MRITDLIKNAKGKMISFEITPQDKGKSINEIFYTIDRLIEFNPAFITVTYHQQRVVYEEVEGVIHKRPLRKKAGTVGICSAIHHRYNIETVPHFICGGFSKYDIEDALIDLHFLGFKNIFVIRGDPLPGQKDFIPEKDGYLYAKDLVKQINNMNKGIYLDDLENADPTNFCIGVAAYPDKHSESPNMKRDLIRLKEKVDAGAGYIITQMFFDIEVYRNFLNMAKEIGITVPIIPGIKPLTSVRQLYSLPKNFQVKIPDSIVEKMLDAKTKKEARKFGIEFTTKLCEDLLDMNVPGLHFFTMGRANDAKAVLKRIY